MPMDNGLADGPWSSVTTATGYGQVPLLRLLLALTARFIRPHPSLSIESRSYTSQDLASFFSLYVSQQLPAVSADGSLKFRALLGKLDLSRIIDPPEGQVVDSTPRPASPRAKPRKVLVANEPNAPSISFIVAIEAWEEGKTCYASDSVSDILGFDREEAMGTPAFEFAHPEDAPHLYRAYQEMIAEDKAACLMYMRVRHKDPKIGYVLCSISCSRVGRHLIGAISVASSTTKAMHNASTAQEVIVIAPQAAHLEYRRWNDPPPPTVPTSPGMTSSSGDSGSPESRASSLDPPSPPSNNESDELSPSFRRLTLSPQPSTTKRVAFVLDRFSSNLTIQYCTNDDIVAASLVTGRSFFDFVTPGDENRMRKAIDAVKTWGVNECGVPSDGGFAFNRFHMYLRGRDSSIRPEPNPLRNRRTSHADTTGARPYRDGRTTSFSASSISPTPNESSISTSSRNRIKQRQPPERGVSAPARDILHADVIFSPQSDGIIAIIRPALPTQ